MSKYNFKSGDIVQHTNMPQAVGIILEQDGYAILEDIVNFWDILWFYHPDTGGYLYSCIGDKWLKPFKGYRNRKRKVDSGSTEC